MIWRWMLVLLTPGTHSTHVRYSDGREEYIITPVTYDVGTTVAIVKKRDGSYIVTLAE